MPIPGVPTPTFPAPDVMGVPQLPGARADTPLPPEEPTWQKVMRLAIPAALGLLSGTMGGVRGATGYLGGMQQADERRKAEAVQRLRTQMDQQRLANDTAQVENQRLEQERLIQQEQERIRGLRAAAEQKNAEVAAKTHEEFMKPDYLAALPADRLEETLANYEQFQARLVGPERAKVLADTVRQVVVPAAKAQRRERILKEAAPGFTTTWENEGPEAALASSYHGISGMEIVQEVFGGHSPVKPKYVDVTTEYGDETGTTRKTTQELFTGPGMTTYRGTRKTKPPAPEAGYDKPDVEKDDEGRIVAYVYPSKVPGKPPVRVEVSPAASHGPDLAAQAERMRKIKEFADTYNK